MSRASRRWISIGVLLLLALIWELVSHATKAEIVPGEPMMPSWETLATRTFLSMADYWPGGLGVLSTGDGAPRSYLAAALAIASHSLDTLFRLYVGLVIGALVGTGLGLAVSWSVWGRRIVDLPIQFLRTLPLLAMVPLFQLWFGTYFVGKVAFVAYGVGVLFFAGAVNAINNVPQIFIDNARTLGASKATLYRTIMLPAIFPELRATVMLSLGTGWATVIGAEYLGAQSGLGYILVYAQQYGYLDRMFLIALLFIVYASLSYALFDALSSRLLRWAPRAGAAAYEIA